MAASSTENFVSAPKMKKKRERGSNWTPEVTILLVELVEVQLEMLRAKFSNEVSKSLKMNVWDGIAMKVSALGTTRTATQVREKWNSLVSKAKEVHGQRRQHMGKTGGGACMAPLNAITEKIIDIFKDDASFNGVVDGFETTIGQPQPLDMPCKKRKTVVDPHHHGVQASTSGRVFIPPLKPRNEEQVPASAIVIAEIGLPTSGYPNDDIEEVKTSMTYESDYLELCSAGPTPPKCVMTMKKKTKKVVPAKSKSSRSKVGSVGSASGSKVSSQDIRDLQLKVLQATLEAQVALAETQKVQREEANTHIALMKVKMDYLREKMEEEALHKFVNF
ncbi:uncharacterized protein LOC135500658 [Lineus longissimus]|uniref:uncharacterized protein LOC135500658 n=1 Tax=Lineus longissimus TaxID=88925 RepID=UPI00315DC402